MIAGVKRDGWIRRESMSEGAERARRRENVTEIGRKESCATDCIYIYIYIYIYTCMYVYAAERREGRVTERKSERFNVCASVYICANICACMVHEPVCVIEKESVIRDIERRVRQGVKERERERERIRVNAHVTEHVRERECARKGQKENERKRERGREIGSEREKEIAGRAGEKERERKRYQLTGMSWL